MTWHPCEVCGSEERKPYLAIANGGVFVPHDIEDSHGIIFERAFGLECGVCGHSGDGELPPPVYLCFDCVPQWLELTALSIASRAGESVDE